MGADFIEKTEPTLERDWDDKLTKLIDPNLFPTEKTKKPRTYQLRPVGGHTFRVGEYLTLHQDGDAVRAYRGVEDELVGEVVAPPKALTRALADAAGAALARVERVMPLSQYAEVSLS